MMEPHGQRSENDTLNTFIARRIISCRNQTLYFPSSCTIKDGTNVKVFLTIIFFSGPLCLSGSSPLPLYFFFFSCRHQHILTNLLIAPISPWYSSQVLIKHHLSPSDFSKCLHLPPRLLTKGFSVRYLFSVCQTSQNYVVPLVRFWKLSGKLSLSLKSMEEVRVRD